METEIEEDVSNDLDLSQEGEESTQQTQDATKPTTPPATSDNLAEAIKGLREELSRTKQPVADSKTEAPMSDEEKAKLWGVYNPLEKRPDFFQKFFRLPEDATPDMVEEQKSLFADLQTGLVRQAIIGARNLMEAKIAEVQKQYEPLVQYYQQQQASERRKSFDQTYPALADARYNTILQGVAAALRDKEFDSQESYNKALAEGAEAAIKQVVPEFSLASKQQNKQQQKSAGKTPRLPRSSAGGTGGTGKDAESSNGFVDDADSIF